MKQSDIPIGAVAKTRRERRTLEALIRKGFADGHGQVTEFGLAVYDARVKRLSA
ncbi:hypothetical protein [Bradyrhizobium sp. th.b2]|uniref:hypothetical protein n=1 Tax=Bradyrhizobium sp. th-b2 TaxID=172088 RepID=UPI000409DB18|nr:hypothetical protein [Bradyrhizobium sp. th.b2]